MRPLVAWYAPALRVRDFFCWTVSHVPLPCWRKRPASRDVFLDTHRQTPAILEALDQAANRARSRGYAIAIGHPYAETLSALRAWQNKEGVALVPLRRLIWSLALEKAGSAKDTTAASALTRPGR